MKSISLFFTAVLVCIQPILSNTTFADAPAARGLGTRDPGVNIRQHRQSHRIAQGIHSGELTKHEVVDLRADRKAIRKKERGYKSDGRLTRAERKDLHQDLNSLSHEIHDLKHNNATR